MCPISGYPSRNCVVGVFPFYKILIIHILIVFIFLEQSCGIAIRCRTRNHLEKGVGNGLSGGQKVERWNKRDITKYLAHI